MKGAGYILVCCNVNMTQSHPFSGLLHVGDVIKQVNGEKVKGDPDAILAILVSNCNVPCYNFQYLGSLHLRVTNCDKDYMRVIMKSCCNIILLMI